MGRSPGWGARGNGSRSCRPECLPARSLAACEVPEGGGVARAGWHGSRVIRVGAFVIAFVVAAAMGLGLPNARASSIPQACSPSASIGCYDAFSMTVDYSGTAHGTVDDTAGYTGTGYENLSFDVHTTWTWNGAPNGEMLYVTNVMISGGSTFTPTSGQQCSSTLTAQTPIIGPVSTFMATSESTIDVRSVWGGNFVDYASDCSDEAAYGPLTDPNFLALEDPTVTGISTDSANTIVKQYAFNDPNWTDSGGNIHSATGSSTLKITITPASGSSGSNGTVPQALKKYKQDAAGDFRKAWPDALGPCLHVATGLGVTATGGVWLSASATVPGGIPAGGAVIATGEVMTAAAAPLCADKIGRLVDDYRIFNDPPDPRYAQLAQVRARPAAVHLHACTGLHGKVNSFCLKLRGQVASLILAADHTLAVDDALLKTIDRAHSALNAGDESAADKQLQNAKRLEKELGTALKAEASIGVSIKHLLQRGGLTSSQSSESIGYLQMKLGSRGISTGAILSVDPLALTAASLDPITRLTHP